MAAMSWTLYETVSFTYFFFVGNFKYVVLKLYFIFHVLILLFLQVSRQVGLR